MYKTMCCAAVSSFFCTSILEPSCRNQIPISPSGILGIAFQEEFDVEALRERLRKMNDAELLCSGKAARFMCSLEQTSESRESVL